MGPVASGISIRGLVQGVGFRPFVFQLAQSLGLTGTVANTPDGVLIHVEGPELQVKSFCRRLSSPPPLARVTEFSVVPKRPEGFSDFSICESTGGPVRSGSPMPDLGLCSQCLSELQDPRNRRYRHPFISCTQCGPRYTIQQKLPYDRPATAMAVFPMCNSCRAEYENHSDRRFHAQPIACPQCGPEISLCDSAGRPVFSRDPVATAVTFLGEGKILAVKGIGGVHLAVDAASSPAVATLRARKGRPDKPFAVMAPDLAAIKAFAVVSPEEERLLSSPARPILLLAKKVPFPLADEVAPGFPRVGVMLPYTPLHALLLEGRTVVMTSGNRGGAPVCTKNERALSELAGMADFFLLHDRKIPVRCDDSVAQWGDGGLRFIRRSRGYAPAPISLPEAVPHILAVGGELKNTICLTRGKDAFLSQHIGDMEDVETGAFFEDTVAHLVRILGIHPSCIAHDLHPGYETTRYAEASDIPVKVPVQHHHAHIAACMAENRLPGTVIGVALDGTGYGLDGAVWGGEVLVAGYHHFYRAAHLSYTPLPGGDAAIRAPWRMAVSYLYQAFGEALWDLPLPLLREEKESEIRGIMGIINGKRHAPPTSSAGRLFDGVAAIVGLQRRVSFEGQAAMALEAAAGGAAAEKGYPVGVARLLDGTWEADCAPLIRAVTGDVLSGRLREEISRKFHRTIISLFTELCIAVRADTGLGEVALSGGVFQNMILLTGLREALERERFHVFTHTEVPTGDGGLSLGQAMVAAAQGGSGAERLSMVGFGGGGA